MLKGIDPLLCGELLKILDEMGHGDELLLVDRNYPAKASGKPVISLGEVSSERAMKAILSVFPLDTYVERPLGRMEIKDDPHIKTETTETQDRVLKLAAEAEGRSIHYDVIPRFEFYERAKKVYAVVSTLEATPYSCFLMKKGVIND
ncbi:hypothetical protein CEUSTIGMA_g2491.t1 [Chlamydomonas eustigma]|uniref:L-fucose mutarotase n=1 Tax=Chlamydomonas eustigma TaxID=1157962 RepID=A0A250WW37_9CHLO|nr:hypothetical protein CEUSTIGMA_g2491.t1 [Chlamydomonas eustigma]|eukprot:GAX75047.1 hypothetical protein CEUSTIGMA_g2491.t1 [Chlamydomonas eustigma]